MSKSHVEPDHDTHSLRIRSLGAEEWHVFDRLDKPGLVGFAAFGESFASMVADGQYRPGWVWIAQRGDEVVARAAWWGGPDDDKPVALDWFDFVDLDAGVALLRQAPFRTPYALKLPPRWRDQPTVNAEATRRLEAAERVGYEQLVERYRYLWTPDHGIPEQPGRLTFSRDPDDDTVLDLLRRIVVGSLDAHSARVAERDGVEAAALDDLGHLQWLPSPRDWWLVATAPDGAVAGLVVPAANHTDFQIGFVGVVPEHRGHGYSLDMLIEATNLLVDQGANRIIASTDQHNAPMVAAFDRAGYGIQQHVISLVAPDNSGLVT